MKNNPVERRPFPDLNGSMAAIRRAALRAREEAIQTGTDLIQVRDGKLVRVTPRENGDDIVTVAQPSSDLS